MKWILILIILIILFIIFKSTRQPLLLDLARDGMCIIHNKLSPSDVEMLKHLDNESIKTFITENPKIKQSLRDILGEDYVFQDYVFIIKKSSIHTCHRDANGDLFNEDQQYPSYTMLVYLDPPKEGCLNTVLGSHDGRALNMNGVTNMTCNSGDIFLFNANMVHAGIINDTNNLRIQLKVSHKDDIDALHYYQGYHKVADKDNTLPGVLKHIHQKVSCMAPFISDLTQENVKSEEMSNDKKVFSKFFYGDEEFYNLPNAF